MAKETPATQSSEVALFGNKNAAMPSYLQTDAPQGNEKVTSDSMATPRITLLQALSPEIQTVPGAKAGVLYNKVTGELLESVNVVSLFFEKKFAVFKDRKMGGGFQGNFDSEAQARAHVKSLQGSPENYNVNETDIHYLMLLNEKGEAISPAIVYMDSTKLTISRQWNTEIHLKAPGADRFATVWNLGAMSAKNGAGQHYFNFQVQFMGWAPENLFNEAKEMFGGFREKAEAARLAAPVAAAA